MTMKCSEKGDLQRQCTAARETYAGAVRESGLPMDLKSGAVAPPSISALVAMQIEPTGAPPAALSNLLALRGNHLKASLALSQHLSRHRC